MKKIVIYQTANGKQPFLQWLRKFRKKHTLAALRIMQRIDKIQEHGHYGDYKHVQDGVYELRYNFGAGYRVYFAEDGDIVVLLLWAGDKSSQVRDISKAVEYWQNYQKAKQSSEEG